MTNSVAAVFGPSARFSVPADLVRIYTVALVVGLGPGPGHPAGEDLAGACDMPSPHLCLSSLWPRLDQLIQRPRTSQDSLPVHGMLGSGSGCLVFPLSLSLSVFAFAFALQGGIWRTRILRGWGPHHPPRRELNQSLQATGSFSVYETDGGQESGWQVSVNRSELVIVSPR